LTIHERGCRFSVPAHPALQWCLPEGPLAWNARARSSGSRNSSSTAAAQQQLQIRT